MPENDDQDVVQMDELTPEMTTFRIVAVREFEVDFSAQQIEQMKSQTNTDDAADAVEQILLDREREYVDPEEKLVGVQVNADESSNN